MTKTALPLELVDNLFGGSEGHVVFLIAHRTRVLGADQSPALHPFYQGFVVVGQQKVGHVLFEVLVVSENCTMSNVKKAQYNLAPLALGLLLGYVVDQGVRPAPIVGFRGV